MTVIRSAATNNGRQQRVYYDMFDGRHLQLQRHMDHHWRMGVKKTADTDAHLWPPMYHRLTWQINNLPTELSSNDVNILIFLTQRACSLTKPNVRAISFEAWQINEYMLAKDCHYLLMETVIRTALKGLIPQHFLVCQWYHPGHRQSVNAVEQLLQIQCDQSHTVCLQQDILQV